MISETLLRTYEEQIRIHSNHPNTGKCPDCDERDCYWFTSAIERVKSEYPLPGRGVTMNSAIAAVSEPDPRASWVPLVDMSQERLTDLLACGGSDTALTRSVQRLVNQLDDPNGVLSAFTSFVE